MKTATAATIINQLQGSFHYVKNDQGDYEHYLERRCIEDFIEEQLQYIHPESYVRVTIEAFES